MYHTPENDEGHAGSVALIRALTCYSPFKASNRIEAMR